MKFSFRTPVFTAVLLLTIFLVVPKALAKDEGGGSFWIGNGVGTTGWVLDPGSGLWANVPGNPVDDGNIYKFDLLCLVNDSNDFDVDCLKQYECTAGENGKPVRWSKSLRILQPPSWQALKETACVYSTEPRDVLSDIAANISKKFQESPVLTGAVGAQPSPHTLKGANTNFFVDSQTQEFEVQMYGQRVNIRAIPTEYLWTYGDGSTMGPTAVSGAPLPEERWGEETRTSHVYRTTGDFEAFVTTTFVGTYSVNGGPTVPIPGSASFASPPQTISVWRSITRNYADDCIDNPQGQGCPGVPSVP